MKMKVNEAAIMAMFKETLPAIMENADRSLESEIYPLFNDRKLFRFFDNNSFEYNTSYDLGTTLLQAGLGTLYGRHNPTGRV
jgi:hypothetical protein